MSVTLRSAIAISVLMHSVIAIPLYKITLDREDERKKDEILVDYLVMNEPKPAEKHRAEVVTNIVQPLQFEVKKPVKVTPSADIKKDQKKQEKKQSSGIPDQLEKLKATPAQIQETKKHTAVRSTKDYINYYQHIREAIRSRLKDNYKDYYEEGDVHLIFTLSSDGALVELAVDTANSTSDRKLVEIAVQSMKESSPFQPFPRVLVLTRMSFNLIVSFKKS